MVFELKNRKKYPLLKSHKENGFIEPLKRYTPSVGMSEIVQVNDNTYLFATMKDRSIYFFNLNDKSIGIEIQNPGHSHKYLEFTKEQIRSTLYLTKFLKM